MPRWTVDQLSAYAKRQLAASANTRLEIRERIGHEQIQEGIAAGAATQTAQTDMRIQAGLRDGGRGDAKRPSALPLPVLPPMASKRAVRAVGRKGKQMNRHNPKVVLAFFQHHGVSAPWLEFQFDPNRKWRFDFAWENWEPQLGRWKRVALEVQGGIWTRGRHVRPAALLQEYEKLNRAAVLGWRVLFVTPDQLLTRQTADLIRAALAI